MHHTDQLHSPVLAEQIRRLNDWSWDKSLAERFLLRHAGHWDRLFSGAEVVVAGFSEDEDPECLFPDGPYKHTEGSMLLVLLDKNERLIAAFAAHNDGNEWMTLCGVSGLEAFAKAYHPLVGDDSISEVPEFFRHLVW